MPLLCVNMTLTIARPALQAASALAKGLAALVNPLLLSETPAFQELM
jgi:hypothetical protein